MAQGHNTPNGVMNPYSIHMVQTFRGNYNINRTFSTDVDKDDYFGTFFYAENEGSGHYAAGQIVAGSNYGDLSASGIDATDGAYKRDVDASGNAISPALPLFAFDVDGVQGAIKTTGNEKWISFRDHYNVALSFATTAGIGNLYSRGTWRFDMMRDPGMAKSFANSSDQVAVNGTGRYSTIPASNKDTERGHNLESTSGLNPESSS